MVDKATRDERKARVGKIYVRSNDSNFFSSQLRSVVKIKEYKGYGNAYKACRYDAYTGGEYNYFSHAHISCSDIEHNYQEGTIEDYFDIQQKFINEMNP